MKKLKKCYICGKAISTKKNSKRLQITLGYSKNDLGLLDFGNNIPLVFYLCRNHREIFERIILSLKYEIMEITGDLSLVAYSADGSPTPLNQTNYDKWLVDLEPQFNMFNEESPNKLTRIKNKKSNLVVNLRLIKENEKFDYYKQISQLECEIASMEVERGFYGKARSNLRNSIKFLERMDEIKKRR